MILKQIKPILTIIMLTVVAAPGYAQDLLARQAPIDRKMRTLDTLALRQIIQREQAQTLGADLYDDFTNEYAHKATELPDSFRIDLRHFCMPTPSRVVTSDFGARWGRQHKGLDIKVYTGDTIRAAFAGKVRIVRYDRGGYGNFIVIRHNNGLETIYGHLSKQLVEENQDVEVGEVIGLGGNTGRSTGSHLHFETRLCGVALNPATMFDFREQDVVADYYMFRKSTMDEDNREATLARGKVGNGGYTEDMVRGNSKPGGDRQEVSEQMVRYHKVAKGETLYAIAKKRGTTIDKICDLNHIKQNAKLRPGQIIRYS